MAYCTKCGTQNADGARFCSGCGAPLTAVAGKEKEWEKEWEKKCEEDCSRGPTGASIIWALIIIFVGLWVLFELGLKNIQGVPDWLASFTFWWIFPVIIGIAVIILGISMLVRRGQRR